MKIPKFLLKYKKYYKSLPKKTKLIIGMCLVPIGISQFINPFVSGLFIMTLGFKMIHDGRYHN